MNKEERLRKNRQDYQGQFFLGLGRGKGLLSILIFALYSLFRKNNRQDGKNNASKDGKGPEQFEIIE